MLVTNDCNIDTDRICRSKSSNMFYGILSKYILACFVWVNFILVELNKHITVLSRA